MLPTKMTTIEQARKAKQTLLQQFERGGDALAVGIGKDDSGYIVKVHADTSSQRSAVPKSIAGVKVQTEVTGRARARAAAK